MDNVCRVKTSFLAQINVLVSVSVCVPGYSIMCFCSVVLYRCLVDLRISQQLAVIKFLYFLSLFIFVHGVFAILFVLHQYAAIVQ